jgi:hypothetical protein
MRRITTCAVVMLLCASFASAAEKRGASVQIFQYPGNYPTSLQGISNNNIGVGYYVGTGGASNGFMMANGNFQTINNPDPNSLGTILYGVNSSGTIVGSYSTATGWNAFSYANGVFTPVGPTGCTSNYAYGINDLGEIVGECDTATAIEGWIFNGTSYKTVVVPGSYFTYVSGINNKGIATVIWARSNQPIQSSLYNGTIFKKLDFPGVKNSYAEAINDATDVVYTLAENYSGAFKGDQFYKISVPSCGTTLASGVNNGHVVVGGCYKGGVEYGFSVTY